MILVTKVTIESESGWIEPSETDCVKKEIKKVNPQILKAIITILEKHNSNIEVHPKDGKITLYAWENEA